MKQKPDQDLLKKEEIIWNRLKPAAKDEPYRLCRK